MYRTPIPWLSKYSVGEKSAMGSSAYMRPLESQLQQKNAAFSVGHFARESMGSSGSMRQLEPQWQQKKAAISASNKKRQEQFIQKNQA